MKNLEKQYEVHRFDIKTSENKIIKKYSEIIRIHGQFDIRIEENKSEDLLNIKDYSLQKIFSLIKEYPEEHILFLYLSEIKNPKQVNNQNRQNRQTNVSLLDSSEINNPLNSSEIRLNLYDIESPPTNTEIIRENKNAQYICISSILYFVIAGLLLIHLLQFIFSKEVRINFIIINKFSHNFVFI